jgi:hypothetical protein
MFSLFGIVFVALVIGVLLSVFVSKQPAPGVVTSVPPEEDYDRDAELTAKVTLEDLYKLGEKMVVEHKLEVKERLNQTEDEAYWVCESKSEFFYGNYVMGFVRLPEERPFYTMKELLEFKDFVKSATSAKGFLFITGYFTRDVHQPLEGPKVTLYNKRRVLNELKSRT